MEGAPFPTSCVPNILNLEALADTCPGLGQAPHGAAVAVSVGAKSRLMTLGISATLGA